MALCSHRIARLLDMELLWLPFLPERTDGLIYLFVYASTVRFAQDDTDADAVVHVFGGFAE